MYEPPKKSKKGNAPPDKAQPTVIHATAIQNGQYGSFYDSNYQLWSLLFQTVDEAVHFATFVAIAKFYVSNQSLSIVNLNEQAQHLQPKDDDECVKVGASVSVKYTGYLLDGTRLGKVFDSNVSSEKVFSFKVGEKSVIKGWEEGTLGMQVGGKRFLVIPPSMAYGDRNVGSIPANSTLCFQVEVVKIKMRRSASSVVQQPTAPIAQPAAEEESSNDLKKRISKMGMQSPFGDFNKSDNAVEHQNSPQPIQPSTVVHAPTAQQQAPVTQQQQQSQNQPLLTSQPTAITTTQPVTSSQVATPITSSHSDVSALLAQNNALQQQIALLQTLTTQMAANTTPATPVPASTISTPMPTTPNNAAVVAEPASATTSKSTTLTDAHNQSSTSSVPDKQLESKLIAKLDQLQEKILLLSNHASSLNDSDKMSGPILIQNVQHVLSTNQQLEKDLILEREKVDQLIEKVSTLRKRNERYAQESFQADSERENEALFKQLDDSKKQLAELKRKAARLNESYENEKDHSAQLQSENDQLQKQVRITKKNLDDYKMEHIESEQSLRNEFNQECKKLRLELNQERDSNAEHSSRFEITISQLKSNADEINKQHLSEMDRIKMEHESQLDRIRTEFTLKADANQLENLNQFKSHNDKLQEEFENRISKLESLHAQELQNVRIQHSHELQELLQKRSQDLETRFQDKLETELQEQQEELKISFKERFNQFKDSQHESHLEQIQDLVKLNFSKLYTKLNNQLQHDSRYKGKKMIKNVQQLIQSIYSEFVNYVTSGKDLDEFDQEDEDEEEEEVDLLSDDDDEMVAIQIHPNSIKSEIDDFDQSTKRDGDDHSGVEEKSEEHHIAEHSLDQVVNTNHHQHYHHEERAADAPVDDHDSNVQVDRSDVKSDAVGIEQEGEEEEEEEEVVAEKKQEIETSDQSNGNESDGQPEHFEPISDQSNDREIPSDSVVESPKVEIDHDVNHHEESTISQEPAETEPQELPAPQSKDVEESNDQVIHENVSATGGDGERNQETIVNEHVEPINLHDDHVVADEPQDNSIEDLPATPDIDVPLPPSEFEATGSDVVTNDVKVPDGNFNDVSVAEPVSVPTQQLSPSKLSDSLLDDADLEKIERLQAAKKKKQKEMFAKDFDFDF
ncbi:FK506-binding protein [Acrasis kona]|uniref:peptidylprolyl isomerase n=1 Tax=Acrasis kona TaxID=1008807 RepID=A0AAW2ZL11_9EUKA